MLVCPKEEHYYKEITLKLNLKNVKAFPYDHKLLPIIQSRVELATKVGSAVLCRYLLSQIEKIELKLTVEPAERSWMKKSAKEAELDLEEVKYIAPKKVL